MQTGLFRSIRTASVLAASLFALTACGDPAGLSGPIDGDKAMGHVEALVKIGPRPFGSDNLAKAADYICAQIKAIGLEPKRHEPVHEKEKKTIRNLYTVIDGEDPEKGPILMLGAHYDTKVFEGCDEWTHNAPFLGAIDGGGAPAVLIELARAIKALPADKKPKCNIWLYWIDAEESIDWVWKDERALLGSQAFVKWMAKTGIKRRTKAFVLLDLIGSKNFKIDRDGNSSGRLLDLFEAVAKDTGITEKVFQYPTDETLRRIKQKGGSWGIKDDHMNFKGIPSVLLIDFARRIPEGPGRPAPTDGFERWWHTPDDNLDAMDPDALAFTGNFVMSALPRLDDFVHGKRK